MAQPKTTPQWTISPANGLESLHLDSSVPLPSLSETDCLIEIEAISLNYRDVAIPTGRYPMAHKDNVVPCSDGAGKVIATGSKVKLHSVGDAVCTLFNQGHLSGFMTPAIRKTSLGSQNDGVLRRYAVFPETGLVPAPKRFSMLEASTLPCAAVTAWNALTGVAGRTIQEGNYVLVQGTGGVSLFAAQIALAMGAKVIATTSTNEKAAELKNFGVHHIINYREDANWGETARSLTPNSEGVHHIIEVGGETTMAQSLKAIRYEGVISLIGFLGGKPGEQKTSYEDCLKAICLVRGISVGSRDQFVAMNEFIDKYDIKPVIDKRVFGFEEAREAYQYMLDAKHWGKICIKAAGVS
ncbi:hypothetical protein M409DRAFT_63851 [Zasmidium cellare ATCC 36951]|uniref:Enoyl reductase (ER) domain-containing protein n=1 Tax=Zasmidium cellare ATCC 36951 TaxID=1080233 RepID=A0A6A6CYA5_ZASCE|nr:uncharacterized protein M409DRAFT_63851 [Zasmidium cellare ATCC 36951]KAF2170789.1 hypothetical protein M409DRAFT_63851 [Zasmidium cellare ATCC 36951]